MSPDCLLTRREEHATCEQKDRHHRGQDDGRRSCQPFHWCRINKPPRCEPAQKENHRHTDQPDSWPARDHRSDKHANEACENVTEEHPPRSLRTRKSSLENGEEHGLERNRSRKHKRRSGQRKGWRHDLHKRNDGLTREGSTAGKQHDCRREGQAADSHGFSGKRVSTKYHPSENDSGV